MFYELLVIHLTYLCLWSSEVIVGGRERKEEMEEEIKEGIGKKEGLSFKLVTYENFREMNDAYLVEHNNL